MSFRKATGRKIEVERTPKTLRALLRRHLREEGRRILDLSLPWDITPNAAYRLFYDLKRPLGPQYVDAAIQFLRLDADDANELRIRGAIEAGWQIKLQKQVRNQNAYVQEKASGCRSAFIQ